MCSWWKILVKAGSTSGTTTAVGIFMAFGAFGAMIFLWHRRPEDWRKHKEFLFMASPYSFRWPFEHNSITTRLQEWVYWKHLFIEPRTGPKLHFLIVARSHEKLQPEIINWGWCLSE
ncbi:hypothetical protein AMTRI_Chr10g8300 [Amborella trichopoda]